MLEPNLMLAKKNVIFELDIAGANVGSQVLRDIVLNQNMIRNAFGTPTESDGIVDHPTYGRCYRFNGNVWFDRGQVMPLDSMDYTVEFEFACDSTALMSIFDSGNYPVSPVKGTQLLVNQSAPTFMQIFRTTAGGAFQRCQPTGTNPLTMITGKVRKDSTGLRMIYTPLGGSTSNTAYAAFATGGDTHWHVGAVSQNGGSPTSPFKGYLRKLKVSKGLV